MDPYYSIANVDGTDLIGMTYHINQNRYDIAIFDSEVIAIAYNREYIHFHTTASNNQKFRALEVFVEFMLDFPYSYFDLTKAIERLKGEAIFTFTHVYSNEKITVSYQAFTYLIEKAKTFIKEYSQNVESSDY